MSLRDLISPLKEIRKKKPSLNESFYQEWLGLLGGIIDNSDLNASMMTDREDSVEITSPRHQVFLELVQTECNYVDILNLIQKIFKQYMEDMIEEEPLLNNTEINLIFGKLMPIHEIHVKMLEELLWIKSNWCEQRSIGSVILNHSTDLQRAYPPFINYFEEMKEILFQCEQSKPRFSAFLKAMQTRPECGRQSLQELMIRPVQRLGSISLLLKDILKQTDKDNTDYGDLEQALKSLKDVMKHINEDKRRAEGQVTLFNIFNDIENCPPDIVSSHRTYITKVEVIQLGTTDLLSSKGYTSLVFFLFNDRLEVCRRKSKTPSVGGFHFLGRSIVKPYKHVKMMPLNSVKRVIDISEKDKCRNVFGLLCNGSEELKDKLFCFSISRNDMDKTSFLNILSRTMANNMCSASADKFVLHLEPHQLDLNTSDLSFGGLKKALKLAKLKVERTFSFNKSPKGLKRTTGSVRLPSSTKKSSAASLADKRLSSCTNLKELGDIAENSEESLAVSVQLIRKTKQTSNSNNLKVI
ncbi:protein ECT2-like [Rhynchophorus ferrugineus]|uniref:protein ECT2-like n=1 Tax=Rhynchophorus ferrugineus TaxID=354439 RepID=UPI003FCE7513